VNRQKEGPSQCLVFKEYQDTLAILHQTDDC